MYESYMGNGANPITGVQYRFDGHTITLADPGWYLKSIYDTGDGIHENDLGRTVISSNAITQLESIGFL